VVSQRCKQDHGEGISIYDYRSEDKEEAFNASYIILHYAIFFYL